jgi:diaminopimelate decarboxylase
LRIGGVDLAGLAVEFGTPLFVYDEAHLRAMCREAVEAWGDGVAYATKAFLCVAMARLAHEEGMCLDVSTGGELHVALSAGVPAERLVLHGSNKSDAELSAALAVGVGRVVIDSFDEIDRLERLVAGSLVRPKVLARITPGVEVHTHEFVQTGQDDSKFGFGLASGAAVEAVARLSALDVRGVVEFVGIHAHLGSQVFALAPFARAIPSWWWEAVWGSPTSTGRRPRRWPSGPPRCVRPVVRRASPTRSGSRPSPADRSWPPPASRSTGWGRSRTSLAIERTCRWTAG